MQPNSATGSRNQNSGFKNYVVSQGGTVKEFRAYTSGEAAAMKTACPNVW
jgi:hypothetical protein